MAKAMGMAEAAKSAESTNTLARLRVEHNPIMGKEEVKGKQVNIEVVEAGTFRLEIPDVGTYYAKDAVIRPFMQRFMYKRFVKGVGGKPNNFVKTVMADTLNIDLKDSDGKFNCGKPTGYIEDFKALPKEQQDFLKTIKRVRVVFGTVEMIDATDAQGEPVELDAAPFIWEVDNRDTFKTLGVSFASLAKMQRLPLQHTILLTNSEDKLPNGKSYFTPVPSLDVTSTLEITQADQTLLTDFMSWVDKYNNWVVEAWQGKVNSEVAEDEADVIDDIVDIEVDDEVEAA